MLSLETIMQRPVNAWQPGLDIPQEMVTSFDNIRLQVHVTVDW
jgi:hypothetical protein